MNFDDPTGFGWTLVIGSILVAMLIVARLSSRKLTEPQRRGRINKFKAAGVIVLLYWLYFSNPLIISHSSFFDREYQVPSNLEASESVIKQFDEQHHRLELLEREVNDLRGDLYKAHRNYSNFLYLMMLLGSIFITDKVFDKKDPQPQEEIQTLNL